MTEKVTNDNSIFTPNTKLPDDLCDKCVELFEYRYKNQPSTIILSKEQYTPLDRKDIATYIDWDATYDFELSLELGAADLHNDITFYLNKAVAEYYEIFDSLRSTGIRSTRMKLQRTVKGGGYHSWHHEATGVQSSDRVLVWTIYLNDVEEGGETEFLYQSRRIEARTGRVMFCPAGYTHTHRGNPPLSGDKYCVTTWLEFTH